MSRIIAPRPSGMDNIPDGDFTVTDCIASMLQDMDEAEDKYGDPAYDYYSMAHWVVEYIKQQIT